MRVVPDAIPRNVRDADVGAALAVVLEFEFRAARALDQHVLEHGAADEAEVVIVGDVAQRLGGGLGAVLLGGRAGECFRIGACLALHAAEQRDLVVYLVDDDGGLAARLQDVQSPP